MTGDPALVFLHGWLGNAGWWDAQVAHFAPRRRVVAADLGHRPEAVIDDVPGRVVLVGHSMSGNLIVQLAARMPDRVAMLVPVDTLHDLDGEFDGQRDFFDSLRRDFHATVQSFFRDVLFPPTAPRAVVDRVLGDARRADPAVALPMLEKFGFVDVRPALKRLSIPVRAINSDRFPTNVEGNRKYADYDVRLIRGVGHWPMLEAPDEFNAALGGILSGI